MAVQTVETPSAGAQPGRECTRCRRWKSVDEFYWDSRYEKPKSPCCDCENACKRARYVPRGPRKDLWTPEEVAALRRARDAMEAVALTGRTVNACRNKCWDLGIRFPRKKPSEMRSKWAGTRLEAAVIEAAGKRISYSAIAKRHGLTREAVAGIIWRWRKRNRP